MWSTWLVLLSFISIVSSDDIFTEELSINRLRTENLLSHFRFVITSDGEKIGPNYSLFPRIIAELIDEYSLEELSLSLGQGRWHSAKWAIPPQPNGPTGAHVLARIHGNNTDVDLKWKHLINSLNGIFCTSLTSLIPTLTTSHLTTKHGEVRYGAMGSEKVCTENLTPWKKLLPCKQNGLATLLNPMKMYESVYHSMGLHLEKLCDAKKYCKWRLELTISLVSEVALRTRSLDWHLSDIFGRNCAGHCNVAHSSHLLVDIDKQDISLEPKPSSIKEYNGRNYGVYDLKNIDIPSFSVSSYYKDRLELAAMRRDSLISISSTLGGTDQNKGVMVTRIENKGGRKKAAISHLIPWFVRIYYHTINIKCNRIDNKLDQQVTFVNRQFSPAVSRNQPSFLRWELYLPDNSICILNLDFDKAFLRIREFPSDANHGMYVPSVQLELFDTEGLESERTTLGGYKCTAMEELNANCTPPSSYTLHSNVLLIALPVPDFSMPFNVICFVTTTIALCFGPIHSFSTKMLIPINTSLPMSPFWRKTLRGFLIILLILAFYAQYHEIGMQEIRRSAVEFFEKMNSM